MTDEFSQNDDRPEVNSDLSVDDSTKDLVLDEQLLDDRAGDDPDDAKRVAKDSLLADHRIALVGRFGGMNQREASNVIRSYGGTVVDLQAKAIDWVVVGANESPLAEGDLIGGRHLSAAARGELQVLQETELWQRLGLVDVEQSVRQYYTPVMLAELLGVSVRVIRRWHRRGLITPVRTLHRLPYFDFREVTTARRLAGWIAAGASPQAIEQRLVELIEVLPNTQRPLEQLNILVEGKQVLLQSGEGLIESGGQLRFDFDSLDDSEKSLDPYQTGGWVAGKIDAAASDIILLSDAVARIHGAEEEETDPLLAEAYRAEDEGDFDTAIDCLRVLLGRDGPRADLQFHLGELLYRIGDKSAARERYFAAIEVDPDFVEARCSLGIVLAEQGHYDWAIAALQGALELHDDYPDAHYHLSQAIEAQLEQADILPEKAAQLREKADEHWRLFTALSPESPWVGSPVKPFDPAQD